MERTAKEALVGELKDIFSNTSAAVLVDYRGLEANQVVELRKKLNGVSSQMKVIKNTLAKIAAKDTPFEGLSEQFVETRALIFNEEDPVQQAKILTEFAKGNSKVTIHGGVLVSSGRTSILNETEVQALSKLPSQEELIAKLLFLLQAPATQFVRTLNEVPASFVRVVSAIAESKN